MSRKEQDPPAEQTATPVSPPPRAADRIRKTAYELFYREGIRAVGVDTIVDQAGVTKPSLYRAFPSKDELAAAYLRDFEVEFWKRFDAAIAAHSGDPRAQVRDLMEWIARKATRPGYRGCGLSNATVEYPDPENPARRVAVNNKRELRRRLRNLAAQIGAASPEALGDALLLLMEGAWMSVQMFGEDGPAQALPAAADQLIAAHLASLKKRRTK